MKTIITFLLSMMGLSSAFAQELAGVFYDPRDRQEYETVILEFEIDGTNLVREWFTTNLNFEKEGSFCYKNYQEYCNSYGRLYAWTAAMDACPTGWHLSTQEEWDMLTTSYGGVQFAAAEIKEGGDSGLEIKMSGFGEQDGSYIDIGVNGYYWNTADLNAKAPGLITFHTGEEYLSSDQINQTHRNSVRCVKDY
ncbi:major paralogous domain-containing protein [Reichenbachiella faecimaris]|uniref:Major paralogous domain-containing protein n=1 Tax=Reichenbachiella faecimaris TaxID=692418 RepID=A0A1W2G5P2_REIFA|nr:FISUMP domain-containing protein [Reichenbachiella faecimaris]SMD31985.1 major paralogous domain-containing protein [Reichenbachiella faecimaris]